MTLHRFEAWIFGLPFSARTSSPFLRSLFIPSLFSVKLLRTWALPLLSFPTSSTTTHLPLGCKSAHHSLSQLASLLNPVYTRHPRRGRSHSGSRQSRACPGPGGLISHATRTPLWSVSLMIDISSCKVAILDQCTLCSTQAKVFCGFEPIGAGRSRWPRGCIDAPRSDVLRSQSLLLRLLSVRADLRERQRRSSRNEVVYKQKIHGRQDGINTTNRDSFNTQIVGGP